MNNKLKLQVQTDGDKIDAKYMDKDELYNRFERSIVIKNQADEYITMFLNMIEKALNYNGEYDKQWYELLESLGYPYHTKCIKNEPNILIDDNTDEYWLSGDVICIDSDGIYPNIETRFRMNFSAFDSDNHFEFINIIISNVSIIERWLEKYKEDTNYYIIYNNLAPEEINFFNNIISNIDELKNGKLFSQIICIDKNNNEDGGNENGFSCC